MPKKPHIKKVTHCHCVFCVWRIFWISWSALALLPLPMGCGGKPWWLSSPSQPSGHAHQYLVHHKPKIFGINVEDGIAEGNCLLPAAPAVVSTTCSGHSSWDLSSVSHCQKKPCHRRKGWGISPKNNEKDKNSTGKDDKKHLKFKLARMSFSVITGVLTAGLVLGSTWHLGLIFSKICDLLGRGGSFSCPLLRSCLGAEGI